MEEEADQEKQEEQEESVFSDNPDWYLRMQEDSRKGWANYD